LLKLPTIERGVAKLKDDGDCDWVGVVLITSPVDVRMYSPLPSKT
jgi:hypothetical protein